MGEQWRAHIANEIFRVPVVRRAVRMQVDDDRQTLRERHLDRVNHVPDQCRAAITREGKQWPGIDRQPHEVDARAAQGRKVAAGRDRSIRLIWRPIIRRLRRRKLAREREPRPQVHPAAQRD